MKKLVVSFLLMTFMGTQTVFAIDTVDTNDVQAPKWEDYVPEKYQNPRNFSRGKSIGELATGIALTDLIITSPIGIPMIVHSTTKLKNKGYYDKKLKFEQGLEEAAQISDPQERQLAYNKLLKDCKLTEEMHAKQMKKQAKKEKREAKKQKNIK